MYIWCWIPKGENAVRLNHQSIFWNHLQKSNMLEDPETWQIQRVFIIINFFLAEFTVCPCSLIPL